MIQRVSSGTGKDTVTRAQGLLANLQKGEFITAVTVVKNCLHLVKGMTVQLQKRDVDVVAAYNMIEETKEKISHLRISLDKEHEEWFKEAERMADLPSLTHWV